MSSDKKRRELGGLTQRMNSCISAPQDEILVALHDGNLQLFVDKLYEDDLNINHEYAEHEGGSTLLYLCVSAGKVDFVKEILRRRDVDPNQPHQMLKKNPLHVAVENGNLELVNCLLPVADVNAKTGNGSTALHLAALLSKANRIENDYEKKRLQMDFLSITRLLLRIPGIIIDCKNNIGVTPLYFAVDKGTEAVAKELLRRGACVSIEVDDETIEDKIEEKMPDVVIGLTELNRQDNDSIENKLFHLLYYEAYDPGKFKQAWEEAESNNNVVNTNFDNGYYTFLQYCSDQGHDELVKFLLKKGASPNIMSKNYQIPPLVLAGHHGYYKVVKIFKEAALNGASEFVNFSARDKTKGENVLHKIIKGESKSAVNADFRDYDQCLDSLLEDRPAFRRFILPAVNQTDQMGNTPLLMAAQLRKESMVHKLLRCEANIGIKNKRNETPIAFITPLAMEEFLDECLQDYGIITDDNFQLTFKYSFLGPPLSLSQDQTGSNRIKHENESTGDELDTLKIIEDKVGSDANVVDSDYYMDPDLPEAEPLWHMSQSMDHRPLLAHPVITSFLCLKWRRIRPYFYTNLFLYSLFLVCLTSYLLMMTLDKENSATTGLRLTVLVLSIALTLREAFQAIVSPRRYFFNLENVLEIVMLSISIHLSYKEIPENTQHTRNLAAGAILLSWAEAFLMAGRHHKLSTFIKMFSTVSFNFMVFLSWYIFIILAFGLAFFFTLSGTGDGNAYFKDPEKSILKTVIMSLTGELEFENVEFGEEQPIYGKLVYLLWVFFIMLVLVNLLNGLAVSDISLIQKEAQILSYVSRVEQIAFIESMLLGDPFRFLTNYPPFSWAQKLPPCDCFRSMYSLGPMRWLLNKMMGNTLLFTDRLKNKRAIFLPNQSKREQGSLPGPDGSRDPLGKEGMIIDDEVIEAAKGLLLKRQEESTLTKKLNQIEKSMLLMNKQQNLLIEMINNLQTTNK